MHKINSVAVIYQSGSVIADGHGAVVPSVGRPYLGKTRHCRQVLL